MQNHAEPPIRRTGSLGKTPAHRQRRAGKARGKIIAATLALTLAAVGLVAAGLPAQKAAADTSSSYTKATPSVTASDTFSGPTLDAAWYASQGSGVTFNATAHTLSLSHADNSASNLAAVKRTVGSGDFSTEFQFSGLTLNSTSVFMLWFTSSNSSKDFEFNIFNSYIQTHNLATGGAQVSYAYKPTGWFKVSYTDATGAVSLSYRPDASTAYTVLSSGTVTGFGGVHTVQPRIQKWGGSTVSIALNQFDATYTKNATYDTHTTDDFSQAIDPSVYYGSTGSVTQSNNALHLNGTSAPAEIKRDAGDGDYSIEARYQSVQTAADGTAALRVSLASSGTEYAEVALEDNGATAAVTIVDGGNTIEETTTTLPTALTDAVLRLDYDRTSNTIDAFYKPGTSTGGFILLPGSDAVLSGYKGTHTIEVRANSASFDLTNLDLAYTWSTGLNSKYFNVSVDPTTGGVYQLSDPSDSYGTNYVMNPTLHPAFNIDDSRWVGDMEFGYNKGSSTTITRANTSLSDSTRTVQRTSQNSVAVSYPKPSTNTYGIKDFNLTETYSLAGTNQDQLDWSIKLDNTSGQSLDFQDIALPMLMNSWWDGGNQTGIYEQNVSRHSFVADDGSYVYWQRPNGQGPYLVMVPQAGTSLEFKDHARAGQGTFGESDPSWEGLEEFYIHANAAATTRPGAYLPTTTSTLAPGASRTYGFTFRWANSYSDLRNVLYDAGVVDVASLPGMVIPQDQKATLAVRAKDGIDSVVGQDGKNITITRKADSNGYQIYQLDFATLGTNNVTVYYGGGRKSVLQYDSTEPIEKLIDISTKFLVANQQAKTTHSYNGAFLQWDMKNKKQISYADYPGGGWEQWMAGGSDDLGLSPAEFLSEKNVQLPDQTQVSAIDYYLKNFIWGYLQSKKDADGNPTYQVYRWYDGQDGTPSDQGTWRVYNYVHVANTWFNMYRIASAYPQLTTWLSADDYLMKAYNTLKAMYTLPPSSQLGDAANTLGLMGESTLPDIIAALQPNHPDEAAQLLALVKKKADNMFAQNYPFASEMSIDTTGFESSYTLAKMFGNTALANKVQAASLAARGTQPLWYYDGSDDRSMGEPWWNLGYETQLGAWQQQDYLENYPVSNSAEFDEELRSTYAAYNAGWANINSGQISSDPANYGAASWQYQSELGATEYSYIPNLNGWWAWSGEADLGFWGGLRTAAVDVVDDDIVGLYSYGGDITDANGTYTIVPKDGVRQRLNMFNDGDLGMVLNSSKYTQAVIAKNLSSIDLTLQSVTDGTDSPSITLTKLPAGSYNVYVAGKLAETITSNGTTVTVPLTKISGDKAQVHIEAVVDKTALKTAIDSAKKLKTSDYTPSTWNKVRKALNTAHKVLTDDSASSSDVDAALSALQGAIDGLVRADRGSTNPPGPAEP